MSIQALAAAFRVKTPSPIAKAVLLAMADHAKADGSNIYPSRESLAEKTQFCKRTISRGIAELLDAGFITITRYGNGGPNTYSMPLDASVYIPDSNQCICVKPSLRRKSRPPRKKKTDDPCTSVTSEGITCNTPVHLMQPNLIANHPLTGEGENFNPEIENVYRDIEDQIKPTSRPVLRCDVSETSEWTWPLEIFDDSQPFSHLPCYRGWTERQLRAECKDVPMAFDLYCWRIERGFYSPGETGNYVPLKGDIGGDE